MMKKGKKSQKKPKRKNRKSPFPIALCLGVFLVIAGWGAGDNLPVLDDIQSALSDLPASFRTLWSEIFEEEDTDLPTSVSTLEEVPEYTGEPYVILEDDQPNFTAEEKTTTESFEYYSRLDRLGRCGVCMANVGRDLMPAEERGSIGGVRPSGWQLAKYDIVDGKYLYNRCHLLGYQLTGENANVQNLITGTRYMNTVGMLPFENQVHDYVEETGNHVLYRVTPIFEGDDLVARGVEMEGWSVEDEGEGVCFHVFVYNVQPGISINYANGDNALENTL